MCSPIKKALDTALSKNTKYRIYERGEKGYDKNASVGGDMKTIRSAVHKARNHK